MRWRLNIDHQILETAAQDETAMSRVNSNLFKSHLKAYLDSLWALLYRIRLVLPLVMAIGLLTVICGVIYSITGPMPGPENGMVNPTISLGQTEESAVLRNIGIYYLNNTFVVGLLLLTSIIHLGLAALASFIFSLLRYGMTIAWFEKLPGTSIVDGFKALSAHFVPEFVALSLMVSLSLWIGGAWFRPDAGTSRFKSVKSRYKKSLPAIPLILVLLIFAAVIEGSISLPTTRAYAQEGLFSEETQTVTDLDGLWTIKVPVSWILLNNSKQSETLRAAHLLSPNLPISLDIRVSSQKGALASEEVDWQIVYDAMFQKLGQKAIGDISEVNLDGFTVHRVQSRGFDYSIEGIYEGKLQGITLEETHYVLPYVNQDNQTTSFIVVKFITFPEFSSFFQPLEEHIIASMRFNLGSPAVSERV